MTATQVARRLGLPAILLIACALIPLSVESLHAQQSTVSPSARARAISTLQAQPLSFEPNRGQTLPQVRYLARTSSYDVFLLPDAAWFAVPSQNTSAQFHMRMVGADPHTAIVSAAPLPGVSNYFIGNDPAKWRAGIPQFAQVSYQNLYPGIGLTLQGSRRNLNLTFALQPGAANAVRLAFDGAVSTDAQGNLIVSSNNHNLILGRPAAYQYSNGVQSPVDVRYTIGADNQVSFLLGVYDHSRPLVIAPTVGNLVVANIPTAIAANHSSNWKFYLALVPVFGLALLSAGASSKNRRLMGLLLAALAFSGTGFLIACGGSGSGGGGNGGGPGGGGGGGGSSSIVFDGYLGGGNDDKALAVTTDSSGNIFLTGEAGNGFPTLSGPGSVSGPHDAFVIKFNSSGLGQYVTLVGGTSDDAGVGIVVDSSGNAYITGSTTAGTNFPNSVTFSSGLGLGGGSDVFITELNSSGAMTASSVVGGTGSDVAEGIALDSSGNIYVAGETDSGSMFTSPINGFSAQRDAFVMEVSFATNAFIHGTFLGGTQGDLATGIAVDSSNNVYISGDTGSSGLELGPAGTSFTGTADGFAAKFDTGLNLVYFTYLGGSTAANANGIAINTSSGVAYIVGNTTSSDFPHGGTPFQASLKGAQDATITQINADGTIGASSFLGGTGNADDGLAIAIDSNDNVFVTGSTDSTDFPLQSALSGLTARQGTNDAFVSELNSSLSSLTFSSYFGGTGSEDENLASSPSPAGGIAVNGGNIVIVGATNSTSGIPGVQNSFGGGTSDAFIAKITP